MKKLLIIGLLLGGALVQAASLQDIQSDIAYNRNTLQELEKFVDANLNSTSPSTRQVVATLSKRVRELPQEIQYLEHKLLLHPDSTQKITDNDLSAARNNVLTATSDERSKYEAILDGLLAKKMRQDNITPRTNTIDPAQQAINQQLAALRDQNRPRVEKTDILEILDVYRMTNLTNANPRNIDPRGVAKAWANPAAFDFKLTFAFDDNQKAKIKKYMTTSQNRIEFLNPIIALADLKNSTVEDILIWYLNDASDNDPLYDADAPLETSLQTTREIIRRYASAHPAINNPSRTQYATEVKFDAAISKQPAPSSNTRSATGSTRPSTTISASASAAAVCTPEETAFLKSLATDRDARSILNSYYYLHRNSKDINFYCNDMHLAAYDKQNSFAFNFNNLELTNDQKEKIKGYITRKGNVYLTTLMTLAFIKNTTVEAILAHYLKNEPTRRLDYTETFAEGRMNSDIIKEFCQKRPHVHTDPAYLQTAVEQRLNEIYKIDTTKPAPSRSTSSSVTAAAAASMTPSRPSSIPSSASSSSSAVSSSATAPGVTQPARPTPRPVVTPAAPTRSVTVTVPQPAVVPTPTRTTTVTPAPAVQPTLSRTPVTPAGSSSQPVVASAPHPMFAHLDTYNTNSAKLTIPAPTAHTYAWNFSKINTYLPPLDPATPEQMNIITNYINNLSATDYKYLMLLAKMKATSAEYILTSYCQTWGNALNTTVPVVDILAWYLKAYPASTQTSAANIALEKNIHASVEPQDVVTSAVNWLKSWWSQ